MAAAASSATVRHIPGPALHEPDVARRGARARRGGAAPPASSPDLAVDAAFEALARSAAPFPLAGRDDVEAALGLLPAPRVVLPYERRRDVELPVIEWRGGLRVDRGALHWGGYDVEDGLTFVLRATVGGMRVQSTDPARTFRREAKAGRIERSWLEDDAAPAGEDAGRRAQGVARRAAEVRAAQEERRGCVPAERLAQVRELVAAAVADEAVESGAPATRGAITEWSRRSRQRMVETFAGLNYSPMAREGCTPGMLTLTYPGDWLSVAPTAKAAKRHKRAFRKAWHRAFGWKLPAVWKLEFQRRGAPHFHMLGPCPASAPAGWHHEDCAADCPQVHAFTTWLSWTWAGIVGADRESGEFRRHVLAGTGVDFSANMTDPRRIGIYFLKHGTKTADDKEYQHIVPAAWLESGGAGRFWGFWELEKTDVVVPVDVRQYVTARRLLRRVAKARARSTAYRAAMRSAERQGLTGAAAVRYAAAASPRSVQTLGAGGGLKGGWLLVNDGVRLAQAIAYWLALTEGHERSG
jgi:hypothetical protein